MDGHASFSPAVAGSSIWFTFAVSNDFSICALQAAEETEKSAATQQTRPVVMALGGVDGLIA